MEEDIQVLKGMLNQLKGAFYSLKGSEIALNDKSFQEMRDTASKLIENQISALENAINYISDNEAIKNLIS